MREVSTVKMIRVSGVGFSRICPIGKMQPGICGTQHVCARGQK